MPAPADETTRPPNARLVVALALGLADSRLEQYRAVAELVSSGDDRLLRRAKEELRRVDHPSPKVVMRAAELLESALTHRRRES